MLYSLEESHYVQITFKEWVVCFTSLRWSSYVYCLEFCIKIYIFFPRLFYSIIYLYQYEFTNIYFLTPGYNPILLYFVAQIIPALAIRAFSVGNWIPLALTSPLLCSVWLLFVVSTSLLPGTARCLSLILSISCPSHRISRSPRLENGIRNQGLGIRCAHCYWTVLASRPSQLIEQGNIYVCRITCVYVTICIHIKVNMCSHCCFQL